MTVRAPVAPPRRETDDAPFDEIGNHHANFEIVTRITRHGRNRIPESQRLMSEVFHIFLCGSSIFQIIREGRAEARGEAPMQHGEVIILRNKVGTQWAINCPAIPVYPPQRTPHERLRKNNSGQRSTPRLPADRPGHNR